MFSFGPKTNNKTPKEELGKNLTEFAKLAKSIRSNITNLHNNLKFADIADQILVTKYHSQKPSTLATLNCTSLHPPSSISSLEILLSSRCTHYFAEIHHFTNRMMLLSPVKSATLFRSANTCYQVSFSKTFHVGNLKFCEISDSLTAFIVTNGQKEWIDDFCGQELPPHQHGRQYNRYHSKGFKASFRFVTNFGIETGHQDSKSGLYPKDTECHYFFYGNITEKVYIQFVHFDVEGVTPCTLETASDYVEFSNVYTADRRVFRHCGLKHPKSIESDGDFFRVTFKSNGRFDGTGFKANYEFRYSPSSSSSSSSSPSLSSSSSSSSMDNNHQQQNENINVEIIN
ncbi:hypothetical protein DERF_004297 [Dermatophagoides farinae]|uniref:CUB domain-containing protein n=1 Tax=Dermatophagoides farinae TaxID=6954 RepID=A0A922I3H8_DERFA|nr:hypothetical protein DERF_004297 [Dermatophagoides farinae]